MKDLKHLLFFETLLDDADNELIKQAKAEGGRAVGYTCYHIPEPLLNVDNCFSVRLRAPRTGSLDIATYYMSNYTCEFARALLERAIEGGYRFLDAVAGVDACSMMNRAMEHFEILNVNTNPGFFVTHCDIPYKIESYTLDSYVKQMRLRLLDRLTENYGVDTSDAAIRKAVEEHNEVCRIITEIGELRKLDNVDIIIMYQNVACKNMATVQGILDEQGRERGYHLIWIEHDLMDPRTVSRKTMRDKVNQYMQTVMRAEPVDASLMDFDDKICM